MTNASAIQSLVSTYLSLNSRFVFSSVLRERNKSIIEASNNNPQTIQALSPYIPFVLLINPDNYTFSSWKHLTSTSQGIDGPMEIMTPIAELPTLQISGNSGDLELLQSQWNDPNNAVFNQNIPPGAYDLLQGNYAIDFSENNGNKAELINTFYSFMANVSNNTNVKQTTFMNLIKWCEEPNVISSNEETFHNLKRITIFSSLYPIGKTLWGFIDSPISTQNTALDYRMITYSFTMKILKEDRNDCVTDPFNADGSYGNSGNPNPTSLSTVKQTSPAPPNNKGIQQPTIIQPQINYFGTPAPPTPPPAFNPVPPKPKPMPTVISTSKAATLPPLPKPLPKPVPAPQVTLNTTPQKIVSAGTTNLGSPATNGIAPPAASAKLGALLTDPNKNYFRTYNQVSAVFGPYQDRLRGGYNITDIQNVLNQWLNNLIQYDTKHNGLVSAQASADRFAQIKDFIEPALHGYRLPESGDFILAQANYGQSFPLFDKIQTPDGKTIKAGPQGSPNTTTTFIGVLDLFDVTRPLTQNGQYILTPKKQTK